MLGLEVVGPEDEQFVFAYLSVVFFGLNAADNVVVVVIQGVCVFGVVANGRLYFRELIDHSEYGHSRDLGRGWVINTAGDVAVSPGG